MYFEISLYRVVSVLVSVLGNPKTTLRFSDSLERLTEPRKTAILTLMVYYSEKI